MPSLRRRPSWALPDSAATPESVFRQRRTILAGLGFGGLGALGLGAFGAGMGATPAAAIGALPPDWPGPYARNPAFADAGRPVTPEEVSARYNNFYEFGAHKQIYDDAQALETEGWTISVEGLVEAPFTIATGDLIPKMPVEERVVRHRCVEAWSMVVPWLGFPLAELVKLAKPLGSAKFVRFETFQNPDIAPGQKQFWYPWPYVEGLTMAEAVHPLSFMVVGAYGRVLHDQFGAPIRLHTPWKYGFKHIKSIVRMSFVEERPVSFWEELQSSEYGFWANVNPEVSHPRWSQATETVIGTNERVPTLKFNGYEAEVAGLYAGLEAEYGDRLWR
jgi:sulfoxide reductase catalytic subunit YedY